MTALLLVLPAGAMAGAPTLAVKGSLPPVQVNTGDKPVDYLWLSSQGMLVLEVGGPTNVGLHIRALTFGDEKLPPVDLTVVRDDEEQGTVRFPVPAAEGVGVEKQEGLRASGEVLVKIEVPAGKHTYQVLVTGPSRGIAVVPFLGPEFGQGAIVATPGRPGTPGGGVPPRPRIRRPLARVEPLVPPEPEILAAVEGGAVRQEKALLLPSIIPANLPYGPGTRIGGSLTGMLLVGGGVMLVSAAVIDKQARDEPVQIPAGALHDTSGRAYLAGEVLLGAALGAAVVTLVCYLVEEPENVAVDRPARSGLTWRF